VFFMPLSAITERMNHRRQAKREQSVRDGGAAGKLALGALPIDMNPLLVAGRFCEPANAFLGHFNPVADADLGADSGFDLIETVEYPHLAHPGLC